LGILWRPFPWVAAPCSGFISDRANKKQNGGGLALFPPNLYIGVPALFFDIVTHPSWKALQKKGLLSGRSPSVSSKTKKKQKKIAIGSSAKSPHN